jgi:uracil-DNA glycosylase
LIGVVRPKRIVAIGRDAAHALARVDVPVRSVRPGWETEFVAGIVDLYPIVKGTS